MKSIRNEVRQLNVSVKIISEENYIVRLSATRVPCNFHKTMNIRYTGVKILLKWPYTLGQCVHSRTDQTIKGLCFINEAVHTVILLD